MGFNDNVSKIGDPYVDTTMGVDVTIQNGYCNNFSDMNFDYAIYATSSGIQLYDNNLNLVNSGSWSDAHLSSSDGSKYDYLRKNDFLNAGELFMYAFRAFHACDFDIDYTFPNKVKVNTNSYVYAFTDERPSPYNNIGVKQLTIPYTTTYKIDTRQWIPEALAIVAVTVLAMLILFLFLGWLSSAYAPAVSSLIGILYDAM